MTSSYLYLNGAIVPTEQATLSPFDVGLLRGFAVFDLLRTVRRRPFLLSEHLERLRTSAAELGLHVPVPDDVIAQTIDTLLELNGHREATVRLVLTGGLSPDGMHFDRATPTFMIMTHELHEPPAHIYEEGARLLLVKHLRELPYAKTTNYLTMLKHRPMADKADAIDLLYHDGSRVLEAATASVYFVKNGGILAPDSDVLRGTIGELILARAADSYPVRVSAVSLQDAYSADEVFLTSTTRGVVPIVALDDTPVGTGLVGPVVRDLMGRFKTEVS